MRETNFDKLIQFIWKRGIKRHDTYNGKKQMTVLFCFAIDLSNEELTELRELSLQNLEIILIQQKKIMRFKNKKRIA